MSANASPLNECSWRKEAFYLWPSAPWGLTHRGRCLLLYLFFDESHLLRRCYFWHNFLDMGSSCCMLAWRAFGANLKQMSKWRESQSSTHCLMMAWVSILLNGLLHVGLKELSQLVWKRGWGGVGGELVEGVSIPNVRRQGLRGRKCSEELSWGKNDMACA